jgi:hypothetical protein
MMHARDITWSKTEKSVARVAFDLAYRRECEAISKRINDMIRDIANPGDIWRLHDFLSENARKSTRSTTTDIQFLSLCLPG